MLSDISSAEEMIEKSQEIKSSGDSSRPANNCRRPTAIIGYVAPKHSLCHATLAGKNAI